MPLWNAITSGSYASGAIWTPDLTIGLFGRDYAQFMSPWSWSLATVAISDGADQKISDVGVCLPDSWDADSAYPVVMRISLDVKFSFQGTEDPGVAWSTQATFWLVKGSAVGTKSTVTASGTATALVTKMGTAVLDFVAGSVPTGPSTVELWTNYLGGPTLDVRRDFTDGLTSWYGFVIP